MARLCYRIERNGVGPYRMEEEGTGNLYDLLGGNPHAEGNHPCRGDDMPIVELLRWQCSDDDYVSVCACTTWRHFLAWFDGECLPHLTKNGFEIFEIVVRDAVIGYSRRQCFYEPRNVITKTKIDDYATFRPNKSARKVLEATGPGPGPQRRNETR